MKPGNEQVLQGFPNLRGVWVLFVISDSSFLTPERPALIGKLHQVGVNLDSTVQN